MCIFFMLAIISNIYSLIQTLLAQIWENVCCASPKYAPSLDNLLEIEKRACDAYVTHHPHVQYVVENRTVQVPAVSGDQPLDLGIYALRFFPRLYSSPQQCDKHVMLIHGINSGPLYFMNIVHHYVSLGFDVCCLSVPGCGGSVCDDTLIHMESDEVMCTWVEYLRHVVCELFSDARPDIFAHSYGTHMVSCFAEKYSQLIGKIIMCDAYGVAPNLGKYGYYVGLCMWMEFPNYFLKKLGRIWNAYSLRGISAHVDHVIHKYHCDMLIGTVGELFGEKIFKKHITFPSWYSAHNNISVFEKLVSLKHNDLVFIWGDDDPITPPNNGLIVHFAREKIRQTSAFGGAHYIPRFYLLKNGGHNPIYLRNGETLNAVISHIYDNSDAGSNASDSEHIPETLDDCVNELRFDNFFRNIDEIFGRSYSTCSISQSIRSINAMYDDMLAQIQALTGDADTTTTLYFVDETTILPEKVNIRDYIYEK